MTRAPPSRPAWPRSTRDRSGMEKPTLPPATRACFSDCWWVWVGCRWCDRSRA
jgi:hypothetical protein